ncbi:MAG: hypothetical protein U0P45_12895 [Acidimicrobiales bacterium]
MTVPPRYAGSAPAMATATGAGAPGGQPPRSSTPSRGARRRPWVTVVVVLVVLACLGGAVAGATYLDRKDQDQAATTDAKASTDPRAAAVQQFCDDHQAVRDPAGIPTFAPGKGAVAYVQLPQPASSTEPVSTRVVQVSPIIGKPNLSLEKSIALVSVAVCVDQSSSTRAKGTCDYELTNPSSLGEDASARLLKTTFRVRAYEVHTGKLLTSGTIETPVDRCPGYAYIGGKGVSNPLTEAAVLAWLGDHFPGGVPT